MFVCSLFNTDPDGEHTQSTRPQSLTDVPLQEVNERIKRGLLRDTTTTIPTIMPMPTASGAR